MSDEHKQSLIDLIKKISTSPKQLEQISIDEDSYYMNYGYDYQRSDTSPGNWAILALHKSIPNHQDEDSEDQSSPVNPSELQVRIKTLQNNQLKKQKLSHEVGGYESGDTSSSDKKSDDKKIEDNSSAINKNNQQKNQRVSNLLNLPRSLTLLQEKISPLKPLKCRLPSFTVKKSIDTTLSGKQLQGNAKILIKGKIIKTKFILCKNSLAFIEKNFHIEQIEKIKIFQSNSLDNNQTWMKIQYDSSPFLFTVSNHSHNGFHLSYKLFSIIIAKRISVYSQVQLIQPNNGLQKLEQQITFNSKIFGSIYKKSQYFGKWLKRFIVIKHNGIYSYRNPYLESHSYFIPQNKIKYIWTRFEILYEKYLVIKIKHGFQKTELAIPLIDFSSESKQNWLKEICRLLP